ncbi:formylglycine-generating enzyme family protein [Arcicella lustrica]|uniref:SUMF1/EgtB/PvdO family nonheme iron enzyme n=1 Tax=Arcicella lustrica TaxID=2984196 RepID=A0ABU5SGQ2_9BACT|nr:SUMF1/EgtB/PvdO family nonheme iron enzyme [Arcicella sp. DC25W]MEA5426481.1 SUMF1/EgtB/PvdO family nonheme iron enzyme [Arcicella sp. DC25W]
MKKTLFIFLIIIAQKSIAQDFKPYEQTIPNTSVKYKMMPIPAGEFMLGSPASEQGHEADESPQVKVKIEPFWMGAYEVTYDEYQLFFEEERDPEPRPDAITRPSPPYIDFTLGMGKVGGFPANSMQQYAALMYCKWLYYKTGIFHRLPTEAEWEYACRAGSNTTFFFGNDASKMSDYAWFKSNSGDKYHHVGEKKPNAWGLYDMLGNVAEWTLDQYDENFYQTIKDGETNPYNVKLKRYPSTVKGGNYQDEAIQLRSANRLKSDAVWNRRDPQIPKSKWWNADSPFVGFRIIRPVKQPNKEEVEAFFEKMLK